MSKSKAHTDSLRVPMTREQKDKFRSDCHWNRETMSEAVRRFIDSYTRTK